MTSTDQNQELWKRVKERMRAEVGEDIFSSWFARMDIEGIEGDIARHSVPTRFLRNWINSHYAEKLLGCWQKELSSIARMELTVRSAVIRPMPPKAKLAETPPTPSLIRDGRGIGELRSPAAPISAVHEVLGGSPLDPRLTFDTFL